MIAHRRDQLHVRFLVGVWCASDRDFTVVAIPAEFTHLSTGPCSPAYVGGATQSPTFQASRNDGVGDEATSPTGGFYHAGTAPLPQRRSQQAWP